QNEEAAESMARPPLETRALVISGHAPRTPPGDDERSVTPGFPRSRVRGRGDVRRTEAPWDRGSGVQWTPRKAGRGQGVGGSSDQTEDASANVRQRPSFESTYSRPFGVQTTSPCSNDWIWAPEPRGAYTAQPSRFCISGVLRQ